MNGDSYSSRGMAPSTTRPKREDGATTDKKESTDRHGSSRDYHVSINYQSFPMETYLIKYSLEMIDVVPAEIDDARAPQDIEIPEAPAAMEK